LKSFIKYRFLIFILFVTLSGVEGSLYSQNASGESSRTIDSLKLALKNAKHDTTRAQILYSWGTQIYLELPDSGIILFQNVAKIAEETKNKYKKFGTENKSILLSQANSLSDIGNIYFNKGEIPKALEYHSKSLKIQEEIGYKLGIASCLSNLGSIYDSQGDFSKGLEYYNKSLKIVEEVGDKQGIANALNNIGYVYYNQKNIPKALEYYTRSSKIYEETGDRRGLAVTLNNFASIYYDQGDITKALEYFTISLKIREEIGDKQGAAYALHNIGVIYYKQDNLKEGFIYAKKGMDLAKEIGYPENIKKAAKLLKRIFQKQNKYKEAFEMFELEIKMRDSINNQETQKAAIKKQMQYTYEKKELETKAEQEKKDAIAKAEFKQKENERNYFIVGFGLVAVLALFILRGYKQKQKANEVIAAQKHLVDEKQKEILDSIRYAKRIQTALMPSEKYIDKSLKQLNKKNT
jgi:tetratricopeptide (TPR) repeat protein